MAGATHESPIADPVPPVLVAEPAGTSRKASSLWRDTWVRFKRHRLAYWGLWVLLAMVLAVLLGPVVYKVGINDIDFKARLAGPSWQHPLGTDDLGRDLLARVLYGGRISLAVGLAAMLTAITVGVVIAGLFMMRQERMRLRDERMAAAAAAAA